MTEAEIAATGVRVVPPAVARRGSFIAKGAILMPSYVNIGAYVDEGTMVDTWATVGSCAQIGKNVHLSGGVGIGGVLEPLQAGPTIIEDNCFIGARSEVVEGVVVEENSVISMGVYIGQSTPIYDRATGEISYGRVPAGSVVVSRATCPKDNGRYSMYAAIIVKQVDAQDTLQDQHQRLAARLIRIRTAPKAWLQAPKHPCSGDGARHTPRASPATRQRTPVSRHKSVQTIQEQRQYTNLGENMSTMERILRLMGEKKASDVYLSANAPALIKINGECMPINNQLLPPDAPRSLLAEIVPAERMRSWTKPASSTWACR